MKDGDPTCVPDITLARPSRVPTHYCNMFPIRLPPIPTFKGEYGESATNFISALESYINITNTHPDNFLPYVAVALVDNARLWWDSQTNLATWDEFVYQFYREYHSPELAFAKHAQLTKTKLKRGDDVDQYVRRIQQLTNDINPMATHVERVRNIVAGVPEDLQIHLWEAAHAPIAALTAKLHALCSSPMTPTASASGTVNEPQHQQMTVQATAMGQQWGPTGQSTRHFQGNCYSCGQRGHTQRTCRQPQDQRYQNYTPSYGASPTLRAQPHQYPQLMPGTANGMTIRVNEQPPVLTPNYPQGGQTERQTPPQSDNQRGHYNNR